MVQTDTLLNSGQSEPPDIKNWFSSYEYESLVLETNDNFGFSDDPESQDYEKECSTRMIVKTTENASELVSSEKNDSMMNKECNQSGDKTPSQNHVSDSEDSRLLSPVEESEPPGIDNWFSSYVYESPEVNTIDDLILSDHNEITNQMKDVEKDGNSCEPDDLIRNQNLECDNGFRKVPIMSTELPNNNANENPFEKAEIPSCGTDWSKENGFVSIKRKSKKENDENSTCVDRKRCFSFVGVGKNNKGDENTRKRTALGDRTNIEESSVTGKWKCPRKGKPDVGPPLKQLRLGQWFHRV